jgi:hypothetical protein
MIAVADVPTSAAWYKELLNARNNHPGGTSFDQLLDQDGTILLCLHWWGPTGLKGSDRRSAAGALTRSPP